MARGLLSKRKTSQVQTPVVVKPKRKLVRHTDTGKVKPDTYRRTDWPTPHGIKHKRYPDAVLVAVDQAPSIYPPVYRPLCPPGTYYRVMKDTGRPSVMVTIMPDGLAVAWFSCAACGALDIHLCRCQRGITPGRSVEHIYDATVATVNGEEWSPSHPNYGGSLRRAEADRRPRSNGPLPMPAMLRQRESLGSTQTVERGQGVGPVPTLGEINAAATTDAHVAIDQAHAALGEDTPVWKVDLQDWESNVFGIVLPDDYDPEPAPVKKRRKLVKRK